MQLAAEPDVSSLQTMKIQGTVAYSSFWDYLRRSPDKQFMDLDEGDGRVQSRPPGNSDDQAVPIDRAAKRQRTARNTRSIVKKIPICRVSLPLESHNGGINGGDMHGDRSLSELACIWSCFVSKENVEEAKLALSTRDGTVLLCNETVRLKGEEDMAQETTNDVLFAIADACQSGIAESGDAYLRWSTPGTCALELTLSLVSNRAATKKAFHLIDTLYPFGEPQPESDTVEDLYRNLRPTLSHARPKLAHYTIDGFASKLVPFQAQNVEWMLSKENHRINSNQIEYLPEKDAQDAYIWEKFDCESGKIWINRVTEKVELEMTEELKEATYAARRGGVLADEMGLGKTVCAIALICLHRLNQSSPGHPTAKIARGYDLHYTGATLIITPPSIIKQWEAELRHHAPSLRVGIYDGIKRDKRTKSDSMVEELTKLDVVLTDYNVLKEEVYFARPQPNRSRRFERKYPPKRSPLVQILWFRVILDEAQMVESPMALVGEMAQMIPRWYSWAVTGTPIKHDIDDLYGVYLFLGLAPCISNHRMFKKMITQPLLKGIFYKFARQTIKRNTKAELADQIHIPPQKRYIVNIDFSSVEQQYYQNLWERCLSTSASSFLENRDWNLDMCTDVDERREFQACVNRLKSWLLTLRQACVHPAVGTSSRRGGVVGQSVKTLDEVLDALINQCKDEVDNSMSRLVNAQLQHGGMLELGKDLEDAAEMYKSALENAKSCLENNETRIARIQVSESKSSCVNDDSKANDVEQDRMQNLVKRRHKWLSFLHRCYFYLGCVYNGLEKPDEEKMYYDEAANTRLRILTRAEERVKKYKEEALKQSDQLLDDADVQQVTQPATILFSTYIRERIEELTETLNKQMEYIKEWRTNLREMLRTELVDHSGSEATGNEYQESLEIQEKLALYQDVYQAILRDRGFYLNGVWLASTSSGKGRSKRSTEDNEDEDEDEEQIDVQRNEQQGDEMTESDEILALRLKLNKLRRKLAPDAGSDNLPAIIAVLRNASSKAEDNPYEKHIIRTELSRLQHVATKQREIQEHLETEYRKLNGLYNYRIEYYRALQELSDHVREWESSDPEGTIAKCKREEQEYQNRYKEQSARCTYLENLSQQDWDAQQNCLICRSDFSQGAVTPCGHMYCRDCALLWFKQHHRCPQCNTHVMIRECYLIAWNKSSKNEVQEGRSKNYSITSVDEEAPADYMKLVRRGPVVRGLGAKLDGIIQHIKYIKETTNGKCVVFSQWSEVLGLLATGLQKNEIGFVHFGKSRREDSIVKFREDPETNVILLHARSHSSGLTLTAAHTVFIVEPVLNDALERQAISRVHRIGQTQETAVYWYIVRNTVEERIHAIHNRRQLNKAHSMEQDEMEVEAPEETPLESQKHGGGELVTEQDLRECFA